MHAAFEIAIARKLILVVLAANAENPN